MPAERPETNRKDPNQPVVSVIVCTLGTRPSLTRCLESVLSQDYPNFEILLVLNGSPDEAFSRAMAGYPLRLLNEPRRGVCAARNHAIRHARGEILAFVDDDVAAHPHWFREIVKGFEDPLVACVIGRVVPDGPTYSPSADAHLYFGERALSVWKVEPEEGWYQKVLGGAVIGYGCNMAFRKSFLGNYTLFPEDLGAGSVIGAADENYMFIQVLKHGFRIYHTPFAVVTHYFERDLGKQKLRMRELHTAWVAYILKMLAEEKGHQWTMLKMLVSGFIRFFRVSIQKETGLGSPAVLSKTERLSAYLRALPVFWRSRRVRNLRKS